MSIENSVPTFLFDVLYFFIFFISLFFIIYDTRYPSFERAVFNY